MNSFIQYKRRPNSWSETASNFGSVAATSIFVAYTYYFFEWLFFITKPSMFDSMTAWESLSVLFLAPMGLIAACLSLLLFLWLFEKMIGRIVNPVYLRSLSLLVPSAVMAVTIFLLIENFSYTLIGMNVGSFRGPARFLYALLFITLLVLSFGYLRSFLNKKSRAKYRRILFVFTLFTFACSLLLMFLQYEGIHIKSAESQTINSAKRTNILILSVDGLIAERMSAYGYYRETTPYIDSLLYSALVFENSFANAERTTGSIASLLSGKLPTTTRVMMRPDSFRAADSFVHLPGTLRNLGYRTADISIRYYADAFDLNMKKSFDYANGRRIGEDTIAAKLPLSFQLSYASTLRFITDTSERAVSRLRHAFGMVDMVNPFDEIKKLNGSPSELYGNDIERVNSLFGFISESDKPFFAHIHLLTTHGPHFSPRKRVFSANQTQRIPDDPFKSRLPMEERHQLRVLDWMGNFYDDAVLDFDHYVSEIFEYLEDVDKFDDTLIVLTSDHGAVRSSHERLPLIIWFPQKSHSGSVSQNVQRLDVAPTILDYLDVPVPSWMEGRSLLSEDLEFTRLVFSTGVNEKNSGYVDGWWSNVRSEPPFFSIGSFSMIHCQNWYFMSLENGLMTSQEVEGHTSPCSEDQLLTVSEARELMVGHLLEKDYDASFLLKGNFKPPKNSGSGSISANKKMIQCLENAGDSSIDQGMCFYNAGNFNEATIRFKIAAVNNPEDELVFNNICATRVKLGRYQKAIEACNKATELRPGYDRALNNLRWAEKELEKARIRAKLQEEQASRGKRANELNRVGQSFYSYGDYQDSLRCWEKALSYEPGNPANVNNVAVALIALKQYERAIKMLDEAISMAPETQLYRNNLAWAKSLLSNEKKER